MEYSIDVVAGGMALASLIGGLLGWAFSRGRDDGILGTKIDNLGNTITLITDELARRITTLENRVQYDGYYSSPRLSRRAGGSDTPAE